MKQLLILFVLSISPYILFSQSVDIENVKRASKATTGALLDENNQPHGYYSFYEVEKAAKGNRVYEIKIFDKNLVNTDTKKLVYDKKVVLVGSGYNQEQIGFCFYDPDDHMFTIKMYGVNGADDKSKRYRVEDKLGKKLDKLFKTGSTSGLVKFEPVNNAGFLFTKPTEIKGLVMGKVSTEARFIPSSESKESFRVRINREEYKNNELSVLLSNDDLVIFLQNSISNAKKFETKLLAYDINTGKKKFSKTIDKENPFVINGSFFSKNGYIVLVGEYFDGEKLYTKKSLGVQYQAFDSEGNETLKKRFTWAEDFSQFLDMKNKSKIKDVGYLHFQDMIRVGDKYYAFSESYSKTVSAKKAITSVVASMSKGLGDVPLGDSGLGLSVHSDSNGFGQLTIKDIYVMEFDSKLDLANIHIFDKSTSRFPGIHDGLSPQFNAIIADDLGGFDYQFTQTDAQSGEKYVNFYDYEKLKGEKNKYAYKSIIVGKDELYERKTPIDSDAFQFSVLPGLNGKAVLYEYLRKEKKIKLSILE